MVSLVEFSWQCILKNLVDDFSNRHKNHRLTLTTLKGKSMIAKTEMLIRRPVAEVFEAFINPEVTTKFWFTKSSGRLEAGQQVRWDWEMYNSGTDVNVKAIEPNKRILIEWMAFGAPTTVEWVFTSRPDDTTFVRITNSGFQGTADEIAEQAIGSTEGFTFVLAGLKALLEHNLNLNLIADRFPSE
jgi:uncharacterized protein YndB with AHSA1/START domain